MPPRRLYPAPEPSSPRVASGRRDRWTAWTVRRACRPPGPRSGLRRIDLTLDDCSMKRGMLSRAARAKVHNGTLHRSHTLETSNLRRVRGRDAQQSLPAALAPIGPRAWWLSVLTRPLPLLLLLLPLFSAAAGKETAPPLADTVAVWLFAPTASPASASTCTLYWSSPSATSVPPDSAASP